MIQTSYINKHGLAKNLKTTSTRLKYTHAILILPNVCRMDTIVCYILYYCMLYQFVKGKGFFLCDVRVAAHTQNCPKNGPLKARLMA